MIRWSPDGTGRKGVKEMKPRVLRRPSLWIFCILATCGSFALSVGVWLIGGDDPTGDTLMVSSVGLAIGWALIRIGRSRVEVRASGVDMVDWWSRTWVPWGAYVMVSSGEGITLTVRGDKVYSPSALGDSLIEGFLRREGHGRVLEAAAALREGRENATPESLRDREVTEKKWEFIPADLLLFQLPLVGLLPLSGIVPM